MSRPAVYDAVAGQDRPVAALIASAGRPVHAYLLVGPPGVGIPEAVRGFAAQLLCAAGGCAGCHDCRRALAGEHPDLVIVERRGASIAVDTIRDVPRLVARAPGEGARKIVVLTDVHLLRDDQYPALLKTLEEPPASAVLILTAEQVPDHLVTIASRCVRVDFPPLTAAAVADALTAEGVAAELAVDVAAASGGRLDRARLLLGDTGFATRRAAWIAVPGQLDGTGATVARLSAELLASIDSVLEPLLERQRQEVAELEERQQRTGERGGRKELDEEHKRQQRRVRTDELRAGLAALAGEYHRRLLASPDAALVDAIGAIQDAHQALIRNPNELLLVQALLVRLTRLGIRAAAPAAR